MNAKHVKHVPGRKTDATDSEWLAELMMHGLLNASSTPPEPQRALRDITRYRTTLIQERTRVVSRVQKLLEGANIKPSKESMVHYYLWRLEQLTNFSVTLGFQPATA